MHAISREKGAIGLRAASWLAALLLVALPIVGLMQGWFASERWPFRELKIEAEFRQVGEQQVHAAVAGHIESGFFAVDLNKVRRSVAQIPWIKRVEVRKRWPDRLEISIEEHKAVAVWRARRLVGEDGALFDVPSTSLPQGLLAIDCPPNRVREVLKSYAGISKLLAGFAFKPVSVWVSERGSWSLILGNGAQIVMGRDAGIPRLRRFMEALPKLGLARDGGFLRADLRYANGFALQPVGAIEALPAEAGNAAGMEG